jgi:multisubunit Na+/H+ antiporter MnhE subunit
MVTGWRGRAPAVIALWVVFAAVEMLLIGKIDPQETPVGLVIALIAPAGAMSALAVSGDRYAVPPSALGAFPALVASVVRDTFVVAGAAVRALFGTPPDDEIEEIAFDARGDDARSAAARALAVAGTSAAPNSIVVGVDRERGVLLVHRLAR